MRIGNLLRNGAITLALILAAAGCGGEGPAAGSPDGNTPPRGEARAAAPTRTPEPMPTRPTRLDHLLLTPTAAPEATPTPRGETGVKPKDDGSAAATIPQGNSAIADLVPDSPRTNDQVLLQDIYARIDLGQFALDPNEPIAWAESPRRRIGWLPSLMPHPMVHRHPYLHIFPDLEKIAALQLEENKTGDIEYYPTWNFHSGGSAFQDLSAGKDRLTYFIYNPWYEAVFDNNTLRYADTGTSHTLREIGYYKRDGTGPYWFGNNSTRGVLAETVAGLLEEAKSPSAIPAKMTWLEGKGSSGDLVLKQVSDWTIEEYISTTIRAGEPIDAEERDYRGSRDDIESHGNPKVEWEILHPQLPILKITAHASQALPMAPSEPPRTLDRIPSNKYEDYESYKKTNRRTLRRMTEEEKEASYLERINQGNMSRWRDGRDAPTKYSISFVMSVQHRWDSFQDPNRWIIRFRESMGLHWPPYHLYQEESDFSKALVKENLARKDLPYPNYWHHTDFMQHRIIGPVVVTVHEYGSGRSGDITTSVLRPGTYSRVPRITQWEAPGHILTEEQVLKTKRKRIAGTAFNYTNDNPEELEVQLWPSLRTPNAGVPAAGARDGGAGAGTRDGGMAEVRDGRLRLVGESVGQTPGGQTGNPAIPPFPTGISGSTPKIPEITIPNLPEDLGGLIQSKVT